MNIELKANGCIVEHLGTAPKPPCSREVCSCLSQPIVIGDDCVLGERSALMGLSTMKKGSVLAPMAQGAKGMQFEAGKTYVGNPADARAVWR